MTIVNSWNEWGLLKHVIVGRCAGNAIGCEPAWEAKLAGGAKLDPRTGPYPRSQGDKDAGNLQLDAFAEQLRGLGVKVDRPTYFSPTEEQGGVQTPYFQAPASLGCMPPRDVLLTVGSTIIEAPMSWRSRYWEAMCYRPLLQTYWEADRRMKWYCAPRPQLTAASYFTEWAKGTDEDRVRWINQPQPQWCLTEEEVLFDAADCLRFGHDLFVQECCTTNRKGVEWLRRQLPECRVHTLHLHDLAWPTHLDAVLFPLRPGLALLCPDRTLPKAHRALFEEHGWELLDAAPPAHAGPVPGGSSSKWLSMNMLSLDDRRIFVEASETHQIAQLKDLGMEPIPVPLRAAYSFGGGLHCCTADVNRESKNECFFDDIDAEFLAEEPGVYSDASTNPMAPGEACHLEGRSRYRTTDQPDYGFKDSRVQES